MKTLQQLLAKKKLSRLKESVRNDENVEEVTLRKAIWLTKVKEKALIKLLDKMQKYKTM